MQVAVTHVELASASYASHPLCNAAGGGEGLTLALHFAVFFHPFIQFRSA
jgi:hypothetical protein